VLDAIAAPESGGLRLLSDAADAMRLSARGYHRVLKAARTMPILTNRRPCAGRILQRRWPAGRSTSASPLPPDGIYLSLTLRRDLPPKFPLMTFP
jgi:magnesium chelatase subunit ChlI-like protein